MVFNTSQRNRPPLLRPHSTTFDDKVLDKLRTAQGILSLKTTYGNERLEAACHRALVFQTLNYRSIKAILKSGIDSEEIVTQENTLSLLSEVYTEGGLYCRDSKCII